MERFTVVSPPREYEGSPRYVTLAEHRFWVSRKLWGTDGSGGPSNYCLVYVQEVDCPYLHDIYVSQITTWKNADAVETTLITKARKIAKEKYHEKPRKVRKLKKRTDKSSHHNKLVSRDKKRWWHRPKGTLDETKLRKQYAITRQKYGI